MSLLLLLLLGMQVSPTGIETRPNCPNGQYINVKYRDNTSNVERKAFEQSVGLDSLCVGAPGLVFQIGRVGDVYRYRVPAGHVQYWLQIFSMTPIVSWADEYIVEASAKGTISVLTGQKSDTVSDEVSGTYVPHSTIESSGPPNDTRTKVEHFLLARYQRGPDFHVLACGSDCVHVTADQLRGEVVHNPTLWESLDILVVLTNEGSKVNVHTIVDGYYAPGLGKRPPSGYSPMEGTEYANEFFKYADRLLGELAQALQKKAD